MLKTILIIVTSLYLSLFMPMAKAAESNIMIFVSFSMPDDSLKGWMKEAKIIHAPLIIRGLIDHSFKATTHKMSELVKSQNGGVELNPTLFEKYHIEKVPAVVIAHNETCLPNQSCDNRYNVVYGDVQLEYALKKLVAENDFLSSIASDALQQLRHDQHV